MTHLSCSGDQNSAVKCPHHPSGWRSVKTAQRADSVQDRSRSAGGLRDESLQRFRPGTRCLFPHHGRRRYVLALTRPQADDVLAALDVEVPHVVIAPALTAVVADIARRLSVARLDGQRPRAHGARVAPELEGVVTRAESIRFQRDRVPPVPVEVVRRHGRELDPVDGEAQREGRVLAVAGEDVEHRRVIRGFQSQHFSDTPESGQLLAEPGDAVAALGVVELAHGIGASQVTRTTDARPI